MIERTLVLIKPDCLERALTGKILARFEDCGMKIVAAKMVVPDAKLAGEHYAADKKWFEDTGTKTYNAYKEKGIILKETPVQIATRIRNLLIESLDGKPVLALVLEGNDAIPIVRKLVGATEPKRSDPSTIRGIYGSDSYELSDEKNRPLRNLVHASEDKKTSDREIKVWFKQSEIASYKRADANSLY